MIKSKYRIEGVKMKKYVAFLLVLLIPFFVSAQNYNSSKELKVNDTDFNINEYFSITNRNAVWSVEDPSVASVVDSTVIPIKAGTTTITATIGEDSYTLQLEVVNIEKKVVNTNKDINQVMQDVDVENPKTGDAMILLIMIISLSLVTAVFLSYIMKHNKYEEE